MKLYNTLTRSIEEFTPLNSPHVTLYTCGPTVYDYTHIGHIRKYINDDILKRALVYLGFQVKHVMNITDVGHLSGDSDEGEDKLEKGAQKYNKTVWEVAQFYTDYFNKTMQAVDVITPDVVCKATDHIEAMIQLIKTLEKKGFIYSTDEAIYFDVSKFPTYGKLSGQKLEDKKTAAREEVNTDPKKRNPIDFALWFKRVGRFANHTMHWDSPWGEGFPGWHIECSAMSMKYLGETLDIHTGGVDHIPVHHENEIAQSEAATGKPFVRFWVHSEHLMVEGQKMSKSLGNFYTVDDIVKKGINPLALRMLFMQGHYRQQMNFTWDAAKAANEAYRKLQETVITLRSQTERSILSPEKLEQLDSFRKRYFFALNNDLQMPTALASMWEMLKSNIPSGDKLDLLLEMDQVFGLKLSETEEVEETIPAEIQALVTRRDVARKNKDFNASDELRDELIKKGYLVKDTPNGTNVKKST